MRNFQPYIGRMTTVYYGYNRSDRDFRPLKAPADMIFIDDVKSERSARRAAFIRLEDAGGGTLVLLAYGDLGSGREIAGLKAHLAAIGATVEGPDERGEVKRAERRAVASPLSKRFAPPDDVDAEMRRRWRLPGMFSTEYLIAWLARDHGLTATRNQLNYRYGKRSADIE